MDFASALERGVLLLDGAMGTELMRLGLESGEAGELWNLERPSKVQEVHSAYLEAGSAAVLTNTFGANTLKLETAGIKGRTAEINRAAAKLAREVATEGRFVIGDIGPTGKLPPSLGGGTEQEISDAFTEQAEALAEGGVDALIVETMMSAEECEMAVRACVKLGGLPVLALMSFDSKGKDDYRTVMGDGIDSFKRFANAGAAAVGANCGTLDAAEMAGLIARLNEEVPLPAVAEPNAGKPVLSGDEVTFPYPPSEMKEGIKALLAAGVGILGGCCGTTPDHIAMIGEAIADSAAR